MIRPVRLRLSFTLLHSRLRELLLIGGWILGIWLGMLTAQQTSSSLLPLMRSALVSPVSISGLFVAAIIPFLLSILAVHLSHGGLLPIICGAKAFVFGFCAQGLSLLYGSSSWLLQLLLMFSNNIITPMQFFFSLRHIRGCRFANFVEPIAWLVASAVVVLIDVNFIAPFLVRLLS